MRQQSGVALVTVLLIVFLASAIATRLATQQWTVIQRGSALEHQRQARWYVLGAEQWARQLLARDLAESAIDHYDEPWAQLPPALSIPGAGSLSGAIVDLQGKFNVNNLVVDDEQFAARAASQLSRLLELLELDAGLANGIADWLDRDQVPRYPGGAEDGQYSTLTPRYLAANQPLASISELRLIEGISDSIYALLLEYLTALPAPSPININTAPAPVLAGLSERITLQQATTLVRRREQQPYATVAEFIAAAGLARLAPDVASGDNLSVKSDFFRINAEAVLASGRSRLSSLIQRAPGTASRVLMRSFSAYAE